MSIKAAFKRSVIAYLLTVAIILSIFPTLSRVHAENEPNLALNTSRSGYPNISASFTFSADNVWNAVDGSYSANRWTTWTSPTQDRTDSLTIDFGTAKPFNQVKLYIYNDNGGVQPSASYTIQYWDGNTWRAATNQMKTPEIPGAALYTGSPTPASILNTVNFDTVTSSKLKVIFTSRSGSYSGVVELEIFLHVEAADQNAAASIISAIQVLPSVESIALSDKLAVAAVRSAYDNLSQVQRSLVTNLSKLIDLESAIAWLQPPSDPPVSLTFSDSNLAQGKISGNVTLVQPLNRTYITDYSLFWGDNAGTILPNTAVIAIANAEVSQSNVTFPITGLAIPTGAINLIAYANNSAGFNPNGAVVPVIDLYDKIPLRAYSSITGTAQESGSKNVTITFAVYNAAHEPLKQFSVENFTLNLPSGNVEHWTGLDNQGYFTNFTNHLDGTYSFVYSGAKYGTTYSFKSFTAHYNPANDEEYISLQDTYDVITPINPIVTKINDIPKNESASSISASDLLSVLDDLDATSDLIVDNLVAYQTAISSAADSSLSISTLIHQMVLDINAEVTADRNAAAVVISVIQTLPPLESISLSNKSAVAAARSAYASLTPNQKDRVTNLNVLINAEAAIAALEAAQTPVLKNITVLSAFSNATGNTITLKVSSVLDITYSLQAVKFALIANEAPLSIASADYDPADSSHSTIRLTLSTPALLNSTSVTLSFLSGALKTSNNELNHAVTSKPVITFVNLDLSHDDRIGVDDVVQMISNPSSQIDVNQDGTFDREDILILLGQISMQ